MFNFKGVFQTSSFCVLLLLIGSANSYAQFDFGSQMRSDARQAARMQQAYKDGRANGQKMRGYLGYEVGVFFSFADRDFAYSYNKVDANGVNQGETTYTKKMKSRVIGFNAGSYVSLGNVTSRSCLAFDWGVTATLFSDNTGSFVVTTPRVITNYSSTFRYWQFGVPLCLDFKYGGEAIYDKAEAFSITLGAGLQPSLASGAVLATGKMVGKVSPMVKAEIGFFAGLQWKIKASYIYQSGVIYKAQNGDAGMESHPESGVITLTTKPSFNVGISFMPFSHDWDSSRW